MTQLVIPHLPSDIVSSNKAIGSAILTIGEIAGGNMVTVELDSLIESVNECIDENQNAFKLSSCLPIGEALVAALDVAARPSLQGAVESLMAVYTAVEMKVFMAEGPGDGVIRMIPAAVHIEYMQLLRESDPIKGFDKILRREITLAQS